MRADDGFVAYLNGQEVARRLAPAALQWNSAAVNLHSNALALVSERINLLDRMDLLRATDNVLAIHGLNRTSGDGDFPDVAGDRGARGQSDDQLQALLFHPNAGWGEHRGASRGRGKKSSSPEAARPLSSRSD